MLHSEDATGAGSNSGPVPATYRRLCIAHRVWRKHGLFSLPRVMCGRHTCAWQHRHLHEHAAEAIWGETDERGEASGDKVMTLHLFELCLFAIHLS